MVSTALVASLQGAAGNQAVIGLLAAQRQGPPSAVQRAWTPMSVTRKTRMRENQDGRPNPNRKITATIAAGNVVEVGDNPAPVDGWSYVRRGDVVGWMRTAKLGTPTTLRERIAEGAWRLKRSGHAPGAEGGAQLRAFADRIHALAADAYLAAYRRDSGNATATAAQAGLGYYNPGTRQSYILETALADGTVLHEMLHAVSNSGFRRAVGRIIDEGATEFLRMQVQPLGPPVHANYRRGYDALIQLQTVAREAAVEAIKAAYYRGDLTDFAALINTHVNTAALAEYRRRIANPTPQDRGFDAVKTSLGGDPDSKSAYEVWAALGLGDHADALYYLLSGLP